MKKYIFVMMMLSPMFAGASEQCKEIISDQKFEGTNPYQLPGKCTKESFIITQLLDRNTAFGHVMFKKRIPVIIEAYGKTESGLIVGSSAYGLFKITKVTKETMTSGVTIPVINVRWIEKSL